jgi:phosphoribosylaminoimidazole (AIR) synthetase
MDRTFNCGVGFTVILKAADADRAVRMLARHKIRARAIGTVEKGRRGVVYSES